MTFHNHRRPGAVVLGVRAEASVADILAKLQGTVDDFKAKNEANSAKLAQEQDKLARTFEAFKSENDKALKNVDTVTNEKVDRINNAVTESLAKVDGLVKDMKAYEKDIDRILNQIAGLQTLGNPRGASKDPRLSNEHVPEYSNQFEAYFRRGEQAVTGGERALRELGVKAGLIAGSDPDGGFTVRPEMETAIDETLKEVSPMRQICSVMNIGANSYKKLVNQHGTASGWVGETDSRPQTAGANLVELEFPIMEMYAMPAASQTLLDDSFVDIGAWLAGEVELEFAAKEGAAFIAGDGVKQPRGILGGYQTVADTSYAWGKVGYTGTGASGAFAGSNPADALVDLYHLPKSAYRVNASWLMNRKTLGAVRKLKDGQGNYLVNMTFRTDGVVTEILGRPVFEMPDMPDIAANSLSIAFGDFRRGYLIVDRVGVRVLRDPFTAKPYVLFYTTKRVGGGIQNFEAIKLLRFA